MNTLVSLIAVAAFGFIQGCFFGGLITLACSNVKISLHEFPRFIARLLISSWVLFATLYTVVGIFKLRLVDFSANFLDITIYAAIIAGLIWQAVTLQRKLKPLTEAADKASYKSPRSLS